MITWYSAAQVEGFNGITSEPLLFILFILLIVFSSNALWGTIQKAIEKRKTKREGTLDEKKLEFEIDKFSIETVQKAVISLNEDLKRLRQDLTNSDNKLAQVQANFLIVQEKNAAMLRYIAKGISKRKSEGVALIPVDDVDMGIIPEVVNLIK